MTSWIVATSIRWRLMLAVLVPLLLIVGTIQLRETPIDVLPESSPPYVEIQTEALGLSAAEVEQFITVPLEANMLSGVAWLESMHSQSMPGLSSIVLTFEPGTDLMRARQMVQERLTMAHSLPNVSRPPQMLQPVSSSSRALMIGLSSSDASLIDLSVLARWTIRPRLMGVPGVANVAIWGLRERQLQVQVDPARLRDHGVTLDQIISTTGNALWVSPLSFLNASTPGSGGFIDTPNQRLGIRHVLPITTPEDLAQVAIEGSSLQLGDVAVVVEDHQPLIGDALTDTGPGLLLVVEKFPGTSTVQVTRDVEAALDAMRPGLQGVTVDASVYRPATYIESALANLAVAAGIGGVLLVLLLLTLGWRRAIVAAAAVASSLVVAALVLLLSGVVVNVMIAAGLMVALVVVIDDAVGDVMGPSEKAQSEWFVERRRALVYGSLVAIVLAVPLLALEGTVGAILRPVATAYVLAIAASMIVALTITPALASLLLRDMPPPPSATGRLAHRITRGYRRTLSHVARRPAPALVAIAVLVVASVLALPSVGGSLMPTLRERDVLVHWDGAPGQSRIATARIVSEAAAELRSLPGVRNVGAHVGRAVTSDEVTNVESADLWLTLDAGGDHDATIAEIEATLAGYPGMRLGTSSYLTDRSQEAVADTDPPVVVRISGPFADVLEAKATEVRDLVGGVPGVVDARIESEPVQPEIQVEVDLAAAQLHGLKPGDVRRAAATLITGLEVGSLFEEQKVFDVVVTGVPEVRSSVTSLSAILVDTPDGGHVALSEVADIRVASSSTAIERRRVSRGIDVTARVEGRDVAAVTADVRTRLASLEFPREYHAEIVGDNVVEAGAIDRLLLLGVAATIGVILLLQALFRSWRLALLGSAAIAASLSGGVVTAIVAGGGASLGALVGLLGVAGLAARSGVILVASMQRLRLDRPAAGVRSIVLSAAIRRVLPTIAVEIATLAVLGPFVVLDGLAGMEFLQLVALVVVGGLVTTVLTSLFILPLAYLALRAGPPADEPDLALGDGGRPVPIGAD